MNLIYQIQTDEKKNILVSKRTISSHLGEVSVALCVFQGHAVGLKFTIDIPHDNDGKYTTSEIHGIATADTGNKNRLGNDLEGLSEWAFKLSMRFSTSVPSERRYNFTFRSEGDGIDTEVMEEAFAEIKAYLEGRLVAFRVPMMVRTTSFFGNVYSSLLRIRFGQIITYQQLAASVGRPDAARSAGTAMKENPLPLLIPCHRVIASDRRLGGYSGGVLYKKLLLKHEGWVIKGEKIAGRVK